MHVRIILELFEKYKCPGIAFFLQSSRCVSNEQSYLITSGLYDDILLFSICFTFSISYSMLPFGLVYAFQFLCLSLFFDVLSKVLIKNSRKAFVCVYIYIYILENINFCLAKNYDILIPFV